MIDRQLLIDAHKCLEIASELLRKDMLYFSTIKEARMKCDQCSLTLLKLEEQLAPKETARPIAMTLGAKELEAGR